MHITYVIKTKDINEYEKACGILASQGYKWTGDVDSPVDTKLVPYDSSRPYLYVCGIYAGATKRVYHYKTDKGYTAISLDDYMTISDPDYFGLQKALKIIYHD